MRGFTLVELLCTISVILMLAGLLLAALSSAKASARKAYCAGNLRQLGQALQMYLSDSKDYPHFYSYPWRDGGKMWYDDLQPYTKQSWTNGLYLCPTYAGPATAPGIVADNRFAEPIGSYGYNIGGTGGQWSEMNLGLSGGVNLRASKMDEVREPWVRVPDDMIALGDAYTALNNGKIRADHGVIGINFKGIYSTLAEKQVMARHQGKLNIVFCDGHIVAMKVQSLLFDHSDDALRRWNNDHEPHRELLLGP
jgi:prepilin-type N-terminal cleavage/methylation domain-containing protein/prepilin-type processing-associated H-X9-DG protein